MAKDKSVKKEKDKKDKLSKQTSDGVSKDKSKSKKDKTKSISPENADRLLQEVSNGSAAKNTRTVVVSGRKSHDDAEDENDADDTMVVDSTGAAARPRGALVPFANPLADEKTAKKVFKSVKKANKARALKRGVKEVVKTLRKSPLATPSSLSSSTTPSSVVVIAADISPMDVISHLPVLCEDHGVPYVYVSSRAELGAAGMTKRPTSVVLVGKDKGKPGKAKDSDKGKDKDKEEDWDEVYKELVKVVRKAGRDVRI